MWKLRGDNTSDDNITIKINKNKLKQVVGGRASCFEKCYIKTWHR